MTREQRSLLCHAAVAPLAIADDDVLSVGEARQLAAALVLESAGLATLTAGELPGALAFRLTELGAAHARVLRWRQRSLFQTAN